VLPRLLATRLRNYFVDKAENAALLRAQRFAVRIKFVGLFRSNELWSITAANGGEDAKFNSGWANLALVLPGPLGKNPPTLNRRRWPDHSPPPPRAWSIDHRLEDGVNASSVWEDAVRTRVFQRNTRGKCLLAGLSRMP